MNVGLLAIALFAACGPVPPDEERTTLPRWTLAEDLRLDAASEDFSVVRRVVPGAQGLIAIPLPQDMEIRLYDSVGRSIGAVGRRGGGPGEFEHLGPITWLGDTLVVGDLRQNRVTYFRVPSGEVIETNALPSPLEPRSLRASDTKFRLFQLRGAQPGGDIVGVAQIDASRGLATRVLLALSKDGSARVVAAPPQTIDDRWMITIDGLSNWIPLAFRPRIVFTADGRRIGFMTVDQSMPEGTYAIAVLEASGDTVFAREYPFRGVPISSSVVDSAIAAMAPDSDAREEGGPAPSRFQAAARERMPKVYSPVESLALASDSTVWVTLRPTPGGTEVIVLGREGAPLGSVFLPHRSRVQHATRTHLWVTETDAFDLTSVVRYRIGRGGVAIMNPRPDLSSAYAIN